MRLRPLGPSEIRREKVRGVHSLAFQLWAVQNLGVNQSHVHSHSHLAGRTVAARWTTHLAGVWPEFGQRCRPLREGIRDTPLLEAATELYIAGNYVFLIH